MKVIKIGSADLYSMLMISYNKIRMRKGNCLKGPLSQVIDSVSYIHTAGTKLKCRWNSNIVQLERLAPLSYQFLLAVCKYLFLKTQHWPYQLLQALLQE